MNVTEPSYIFDIIINHYTNLHQSNLFRTILKLQNLEHYYPKSPLNLHIIFNDSIKTGRCVFHFITYTLRLSAIIYLQQDSVDD
jgi:hypothetical protein